MSEQPGELAAAIKLFIEYANHKGQIPSAIDMGILKSYLNWLHKTLGLSESWITLVDTILALSEHELSYGTTVWQRALDLIASGTKYKMEVIEERKKKTPIAHLR